MQPSGICLNTFMLEAALSHTQNIFEVENRRSSRPPTRRGQPGNCPREMFKTYLVVRYNNKLQSFCPPKIVQQKVTSFCPQKYKLFATLSSSVKFFITLSAFEKFPVNANIYSKNIRWDEKTDSPLVVKESKAFARHEVLLQSATSQMYNELLKLQQWKCIWYRVQV